MCFRNPGQNKAYAASGSSPTPSSITLRPPDSQSDHHPPCRFLHHRESCQGAGSRSSFSTSDDSCADPGCANFQRLGRDTKATSLNSISVVHEAQPGGTMPGWRIPLPPPCAGLTGYQNPSQERHCAHAPSHAAAASSPAACVRSLPTLAIDVCCHGNQTVSRPAQSRLVVMLRAWM